MLEGITASIAPLAVREKPSKKYGTYPSSSTPTTNEESCFVRHAHLLGANDPYSALKTTLKAEINEEAWANATALPSAPLLHPSPGVSS